MIGYESQCILCYAGVVEGIEQRIKKHEHDAWAAAYALDLAFDTNNEETGACYFALSDLSEERVERLVSLVARVTSRDKAAVREEYTSLAISDVKGSSGQLLASLIASQPDYARPANQKRRDWWPSVSKQYPLLAATARRVLALHTTSAAAERK
jgi:hypothetical protein